ncbi:sodium/hydrogen exchanger 1-like isoform X1 [Typha angustifolia]|uniref:sodium/hydrogen exchanger 1-like isoform X1 n=1 Tax=Typha angustifolia TaxID=59011 RepID=UPI003C2FCE36
MLAFAVSEALPFSLSSLSSAVVSISVFVALLCVCVVIGHLLEEKRWANEAIVSLLLGLCSGLVVLACTKWRSSHILVFNEELFFIYLLPPIIFNAGFQVKKKQFFRNFSTILLFGVCGTILSFFVITVGSYVLLHKIFEMSLAIQDYLAIGAIFSATDSVCTLQVLSQEETPLLYSLVFGEGVVNDATSIVLFNSVQSLNISNIDAMTALKLIGTFLYLFLTSTALGISAGLISAYVIKKLYFGRHSTNREVAIMLLVPYLSYMLAELFSLSGILTIFFCGIIMSHYAWHNIMESSQITTRHTFATMSFISETFIFLYVGMDAMDISKWRRSKASIGTTVAVSGTLFALVMVGRAIFVFSLANIANCCQAAISRKINLRQQFVIWWAGLMRGAVTIALSYNQFTSTSSSSEEDAFMITNSIIVVLFSNVVFGSITKPLVQALLSCNSKSLNDEDTNQSGLEDIHYLFLENGRANESENNRASLRRSLGMLIMHPTHTIHYFWRKFDDKYMRPIFGGRGFVPSDLGSSSNDVEDHAREPDIITLS